MDSWKAEVRRVRREKIRRKKMQMCEKVGKSRNTVFFQWFGAPEGRKVGSLKRRVRSQLARWEMKNCTPLWREAHFEVKMYKAPQLRTPDHFWKLRCRKSARRCGAKHILKSTCTKHTILGRLLEVEMSKKCTPLWREAHFEVKSVKNWRSRTTFGGSDVEKVSKKCTLLWREAHFEVKSVKNWGFWAFFDVKMSKKKQLQLQLQQLQLQLQLQQRQQLQLQLQLQLQRQRQLQLLQLLQLQLQLHNNYN